MNNIIFGIMLMLSSFYLSANNVTAKQAINTTLDQFHHAAAVADAKMYLGLLTSDSIFLGTDSHERWTKTQFSAFVKPYFEQGKGWRYVMLERNITLIAQDKIAFFDELLENEKYGRCRSSGVLVKTEQGWKISQYNLSLMVPNEISNEVFNIINNYRVNH